MLRPDVMSVPQLLRQLASDCEREGQTADYVVVGLFLSNGRMTNVCKAMPAHCALFGSHLLVFASALSAQGPIEPFTGKFVP